MKKRVLIYTLLIALFLTSCVKIGEFYVGLTMQPDMDNSPFEPGLNVYGVVKCGADFDSSNYHFEVQKMLDLMDWSEGMEVTDAQIHLTRTTQQNKNYSYDLSYFKESIYVNEAIETLPGDRWTYRCTADSFEVTASCTVPKLPEITNAQITNNAVAFTVKADSTAFLYLVYVIQEENVSMEYTIPSLQVDTKFTIDLEWNLTDQPVLVYVCAYDENLRKYQTTSNTFFKPNAFRPSFSTVEGGYGTFGAITIQSVVLNQ